MIEQFVSTASVSERAKLLTEIIRIKALHEGARRQDFGSAINELAGIAGNNQNPDRQLALSILCKIAGLVRELRPEITAKISTALKTEISGPDGLDDPDDRFYLVSFWRYSTAPWVPALLANWIAEEEGGEKVRRECAIGLVSTANSYSAAITLLSRALMNQQFQTKTPADSIGKRFRRCISALHDAISESKNDEPGADLGSTLREFVRNIFSQSGLPKSEPVITDAATEMLRLLVVIVRKRIAVAIEGELYSVIFSLRDWFKGSRWTDFTENEIAHAVANDVADSLEIAVKSGRADKQLLEVLSLICGTEERNSARLNRIIHSNLGLSEEMIAWLRGKPVPRSTALSEESQLARIEAALAELMLKSDLASDLRSEIEQDLLPGLAIFPSLSDKTLRQLLELASETRILTRELASERGLEIFGEVGSEVRYSPLEHEFADPSELGSRFVRVVRQGVLKSAMDGKRRVIQKAMVRKIEGDRLG